MIDLDDAPDLSSAALTRRGVGFASTIPAASDSAVEPVIIQPGPVDAFIDLTTPLPGGRPANRLRVLVRDPGTLYVYWTTDTWHGHTFRISCRIDPGSLPRGDGETLWSHDVPATGRECWLHVPAGARGTVALEILADDGQRTVGRAYFLAPVGRARDGARQSTWRIPGRPGGRHAGGGAYSLGGHGDEGSEAFGASADAPAISAGEAAANDGIPASEAAPPEGSGPVDVMLDARLYHGHVWRRPA